MAANARLAEERPDVPEPLSSVTWGIASSKLLRSGERKMEAESYLLDGYGLRLSIEGAMAGWRPFDQCATVWQPPRLKGLVVAADRGVPFLSAGQVFERMPRARKWLAPAFTPNLDERFVSPGDLLLSCSGTVGRATFATRPHEGAVVTHDLLRIEPNDPSLRGWLYAFMRTPVFRAIATGARYGHMIKHLEPEQVGRLPLVLPAQELIDSFETRFVELLRRRNTAHDALRRAFSIYEDQLPLGPVEDVAFTVRRSALGARRRLDAEHWTPHVSNVMSSIAENASSLATVGELCRKVWWPNRFKRVFGEQGSPYVSAVELFDDNPPITKRILAAQVPNAVEYRVERDWILMARSGQTYGLNGRALLTEQRHEKYFVSEDIIRLMPDEEKVRPGYLITALTHPTLGRPLVLRQAYGTSIPHLEPSDVEPIVVPRFRPEIEDQIADAAEDGWRSFAEADDLEDSMEREASALVEGFLKAHR